MSDLLTQAFERAQSLPEAEQNSLAHYILELIEDEAWWDAQFASSEAVLIRMADEAEAEYLAGLTEDFDPDNDPDDPAAS